MKMMLKKWAALLLALVLLLTLAACGKEEGSTAVLRLCLGGPQATLDPAYTETDDNAPFSIIFTRTCCGRRAKVWVR